jgi:ferritin-like metal-binding protein YciE
LRRQLLLSKSFSFSAVIRKSVYRLSFLSGHLHEPTHTRTFVRHLGLPLNSTNLGKGYTAMETINELFQDQIKDLYSAESQLLKALPKMAKKATTPELKSGIEKHLKQTEGHVERLSKIADMWSFKPTGKKCKAMEGLIEEGKEVLEEDGENSVIDAALIAAAQRVEHYEISAYGTARALAKRLGCAETASLLEATLNEEAATDKLLTSISEKSVLKNAPVEDEEPEEEEDDEE